MTSKAAMRVAREIAVKHCWHVPVSSKPCYDCGRFMIDVARALDAQKERHAEAALAKRTYESSTWDAACEASAAAIRSAP